jgi:hypothetical protein
MKLSTEDTALFYKLMTGLQFWINQKLNILSDVDSVEAFEHLLGDDRIAVRNALWENPELIESYVTQNPDGLPADELQIVSKWTRFVAGTFQVFRFLKKHTILIGDDASVYGVLALYDSLEEIFYGLSLPVLVQTVLLPFKGKIIYDGLVSSYPIHFGGGIRSVLHEEYMAAKQNGRIITTLEPELAKPPRKKTPPKDWRPIVDELVKTTNRLRGGPAVQTSAFSLLRASAKLAQAATHNPGDLDELWRLQQRVQTALNQVERVLIRAEY